MIKITFYCCALFFIHDFVGAQNIKVTGRVFNKNNVGIENASVVIYKNEEGIQGYSYSDSSGTYSLTLKNISLGDTLKIKLNSLGYEPRSKTVVYGDKKHINHDFMLVEKVEELKEVVLEAWEKIKVNRDTISFRASSYADGSEQVVEDLLKNLPGVEVLKNGDIEVNGKPIDKLLVEGDDLFDEKYKLLSKNLDAKNISEIEILNNFEENPILREFQESEKVALNLKLKEDKKNVWFGNIEIGLGTNNQYETTGNIGLLKKRLKLFNFTDLNNTQKLTVPQIKGANTVVSGTETVEKVERTSNELVNIDNVTGTNFSQNEDVFNDSFLNSLSFVTNLSKNTKIRSLSYYALDELNKQNSIFVQYFTLPETLDYSEERRINVKDVFFATELQLKHYGKKGIYVTYDLSLENNQTKKYGRVLTNDNQIIQSQDDRKYNIFNHLNLTKKLAENKLLTVYGYYGVNSTGQDYTAEPNVLVGSLGEEDPLGTLEQNSSSPFRYTGLVAEIITKHKKSKLGLELSGSFNHDNIVSTTSADQGTPIDSLANNTDYRNLGFSATGKYTYYISNGLKIRSSLGVIQNHVNFNSTEKDFFFVNPKIRLSYKQENIGVFAVNYSFANNLPTVQYLNENYILRNYRTFTKGVDDVIPSKNHNIGFLYAFKSYKKLLLINSFFQYSFSDIGYGQVSFINENSNFNTYTILDGGDVLNFNLGVTTYLKNLPVSIKFATQQSVSNNNVALNNSLGRVTNYNSNYRVQGTTYLNIPLNFKFHLQYNRSRGEFEGRSGTNDFLEASLTSNLELFETLTLKTENNYYFINNNDFLFSHIEVNLNPRNSRLSYRLVGSNLSNISRFSETYISDYQSNVSVFKVLPRYILLSLKYRF